MSATSFTPRRAAPGTRIQFVDNGTEHVLVANADGVITPKSAAADTVLAGWGLPAVERKGSKSPKASKPKTAKAAKPAATDMPPAFDASNAEASAPADEGSDTDTEQQGGQAAGEKE